MEIAAHRARPDVSIEQHVKRRVVALGRSLDQRIAIYLDTKFWIMLRDCAAGGPRDPTVAELLQRLRQLVSSGRVFCPFSENHLYEFMKQEDRRSRRATARLVDELSLGVALTDHRTRLGTEVAHFVHSYTDGAENLHPLRHLVWSKLGYVAGFSHPSGMGVDPETERALQKAFFDHMWTVSFAEMIETLGSSSPPGSLDFDTAELNRGIAENADQIRSFAQAYAAELRGAVELGADMAMDVMAERFRKKSGNAPPEAGSAEWQKFWMQWANLLFAALKKNDEARQQLRTLHIHASLHAAFRWDKARRFTSNDLYDFEHASAALAHCGAFFTEHALCSTITAGNVALDAMFQCRVVSKAADAVAVLKAIEVRTA
jgi:hypothetical protein